MSVKMRMKKDNVNVVVARPATDEQLLVRARALLTRVFDDEITREHRDEQHSTTDSFSPESRTLAVTCSCGTVFKATV